VGNRKIPYTKQRDNGFYTTYNGVGIDVAISTGNRQEVVIQLYRLSYDFNDEVESRKSAERPRPSPAGASHSPIAAVKATKTVIRLLAISRTSRSREAAVRSGCSVLTGSTLSRLKGVVGGRTGEDSTKLSPVDRPADSNASARRNAKPGPARARKVAEIGRMA